MPFMDWRLVTYVMSLPDDAKFQHGLSKFVAREAMAGHMPESIRTDRHKIGFSSPLRDYLRNQLNGWGRDLLEHPSHAFSTIVDHRRLLAKFDALTRADGWTLPIAERLWPYLNLAHLLRNA